MDDGGWRELKNKGTGGNPTLYLGESHLCLVGLDQDFSDLEVLRFVVPATRQHKVTGVGQRVSDQEVSVPQNQSLRYLHRKGRGSRL